jgi:hypothetical protein
MRVDPSVLHRLDPRKSYDRGPWTAAGGGAGITNAATHSLPLEPDSIREPIAVTTSRPDLASLTTEDLQRELLRRRQALGRLQARREKLAAELAALDAEIAALGERGNGHVAPPAPIVPGGPRKPARMIIPRQKNSVSLAAAMAMAVEPGATVSPTELAGLVKENGYVTTARKFAQVVAQALAKDKHFRRIERGRYERVAQA